MTTPLGVKTYLDHMDSKKNTLRKAILTLAVEWKDLDEHLVCTKNCFDECVLNLELERSDLAFSRDSIVKSNLELESLRESLGLRLEEIESREECFRHFQKEQVENFERKEEELSALRRGIAEKMIEEEMREVRIGLLLERIEREKGEFLDIQKSVGERLREIESREREVEDRTRKLDLAQGRVDRRAKELDLKEEKIKAIGKSNEECINGLRLKDEKLNLFQEHMMNHFEEVELKSKQFTKQFKDYPMKQTQCEGKSKDFELKLKQIEEQCKDYASKKKQYEEQGKVLELKKKQVEEQCRDSSSKKIQFEEQLKNFKLKKTRVEEKRKVHSSKDYGMKKKQFGESPKSLEFKEKLVTELSKDFRLKNKQLDEVSQSRLEDTPEDLQVLATDGKSLQIYLNWHYKDHESLSSELHKILRVSADPAMLALEAMVGFYPPHLKIGHVEFEKAVVRRSCNFLLGHVMILSPPIHPHVREDALRLAGEWKVKMEEFPEDSSALLAFTQLFGAYKLGSELNANELLGVMELVPLHIPVPELCRFLGLHENISDLYNNLEQACQTAVCYQIRVVTSNGLPL